MSLIIGFVIGGAMGLVSGVFFGAVCVLLAQRGDDAIDGIDLSHADDCVSAIGLLCDCQGAER